MAHEGDNHHSGGPGLYVVVALILGVVTYIEYYIVEFPPVWMSPGWVMFWLIALSVAKFLMVIWFFMHLRDDDKLYTGFFASGFVIAIGTFVALTVMFLLPRAVAPRVAATEPPGIVVTHEDPRPDPLGEQMRALIETDGLARPIGARTASPRPKDQGLRIVPPAAPDDVFSLRLEDEELGELDLGDVELDPDPDADPAAAAVPAPEEVEADAPTLADAPDPTFDRGLGAQVYAQNCSACHQANGQGIPGAFPPLAGHAAELYEADGGRTYLIDVVLYGLRGEIEVEGRTYDGVMPAFGQLSDEQIAAVLNHAIAGFDAAHEPEDFDAIRPEEVAAERDEGLTPADVHARRAELGPPAEDEPAVEPDEVDPAADPDEVDPDEVEPDEVDEEAEPDRAEPDPTYDRELGAQVYAQHCSACHQANGRGIPGAFPPVAGHAADLYEADGGRTYLIDVILYGLVGPIEVEGQTYNGLMPAFGQLNDEQVAAVINHSVVGFDPDHAPEDFDAIRPEEVAAERDEGLAPRDVHDRRQALDLD